MDLTRRYLFHGHAAAFGGRLVRPDDIVIESRAASALVVTGGRSVGRTGRVRFGPEVEIGASSTFAEGLVDSLKQAVAVSHGRLAADALTATTTVSADVRSIRVGDAPRLTVRRLFGSLTSRSPGGSGEPAIRLGTDTTIDGVSVDRYRLIVELDLRPFQRFDTRSKLLAAADDPKFVREFGSRLLMHAPDRGGARAQQLVVSHGIIYGTLVKSVRWSGRPFPDSTIDGHVVTIPGFGRIFFAEILVSALSRRVTMLRLELGSPVGGSLAFSDFEDNGSWYP
jgi:hypothetical protein